MASRKVATSATTVIVHHTSRDVSECSTNTEDYGTCTENSKRTTTTTVPSSQGIKPGAAISAATQVPGSRIIQFTVITIVLLSHNGGGKEFNCFVYVS